MKEDDNLLFLISEEEKKAEFLRKLNVRFKEIKEGVVRNERKNRKKSNRNS